MIDRQKAMELRRQGKSFPQIAAELNISVAWCKTYLKGVPKYPKDDRKQLLIKDSIATIENELNKIKEYLNND